MQEIKKRRIVLASVLKPVDEPRMFEKIGQSLAARYEVHIIGQPGNIAENPPSISFHALSPFKRLNIARFFAPIKVLRKILELRPSLLIVCTHELLYIALAAKILIRCKVAYDIQENYWRNILYTKTLPPIVRHFVAAYVRVKETLTAPALDYFFLAEAAYKNEITFTGNKHVVLENKLRRSVQSHTAKKSKADGKTHLLFSGTLAETTGVFIAIEIATALYKIDNDVRLVLIGYCPVPQTLNRIKSEILTKPFIELIGGNSFVSHHQVLAAIQSADFGIIAYPENPATANSIPTKLYEYLGYQLPILLIDHKPWLQVSEPYNAAVPFNPRSLDGEKLLAAMRSTPFFFTLPTDVYWESEGKKLHETVENYLLS